MNMYTNDTTHFILTHPTLVMCTFVLWLIHASVPTDHRLHHTPFKHIRSITRIISVRVAVSVSGHYQSSSRDRYVTKLGLCYSLYFPRIA